MKEKKFVLFLHSGAYDKLYQAIMLAVTAASMGQTGLHIPVLLGTEKVCK